MRAQISRAADWHNVMMEIEEAMKNEDIAKELLSVLKEKMMYREGLPGDGWAIEKICDALEAAQQSKQADGGYCDCKGVYSTVYRAGGEICSNCNRLRRIW